MNYVYKQSVCGLSIEINKCNLIKGRNFNFESIPNLRILDNGFLKVIREKYCLTQKKCANIAGVPLRTWIGWESYNKYLPFKKLSHFCKELNINTHDFYKLIYGSKFTYGRHHGGNSIILPQKPNDFELANYLIPQKNNCVYVVKDCPPRLKYHILRNYSFDDCYYKKTGLIVIYSYLLNKFLTTFYVYIKKSMLEFPLSPNIIDWSNKKIDYRMAVIIPLLLTDGGEKPSRRLFISGASTIVHQLFSDAIFYQYGLLPSSYKTSYRNIYITTHIMPKEVLDDLKSICPKFKTSPVKQDINSYLMQTQPTIKFLKSCSAFEQQTAIRIWAITEGSIFIGMDKRSSRIYPSLKIACAHPSLVTELKEICRINGMNFHVTKDLKDWSKISGLSSNSILTTLNFLRIGGFISGVTVAKSSKHFSGLDKQHVLLGIFEYILRQRRDRSLRPATKLLVYNEIKAIIGKKLYKDTNYYIKELEAKNVNRSCW